MTVVVTLIALATYIFTRTDPVDSCGGLVQSEDSDSGYITSPDFPQNYPVLSHCIWLIQTTATHTRIRLTIHTLLTEQAPDGGCEDFIEVRSGSSSAPLLFQGCSVTNLQLYSTSRWLWVRFYSNNDNVSKGFNATWQTTGGGATNQTSPIEECPSTKFRCSNYECVSWSWVCDDWRDCGCSTDCDEDTCAGFGYSYNTTLTIGLASGAAAFLLIVVVIVIWDRYLKRKNKRLEEERIRKVQQAARLRHNVNHMRKVTRLSTNASSSNLDSQLMRQGSSSSSTSGYRPETSGYRPETSGYRPETSGYRPETSGYRPETSGYRPETSGYRPETMAEDSSSPSASSKRARVYLTPRAQSPPVLVSDSERADTPGMVSDD